MWLWIFVHSLDILFWTFILILIILGIGFADDIKILLKKSLTKARNLFKSEINVYIYKDMYDDRFYLSGDDVFANNKKFAICERYESAKELLQYIEKHLQELRNEYGEDVKIELNCDRHVVNILKAIIPNKKNKGTIICYEKNETK